MGTPQDATAVVRANIRAIRRKLNLSQGDLAERLASLGHPLDRAGVAKIETGRREISFKDFMALALALDVSPARLAFAPDPETVMAITTEVAVPAHEARRWWRGRSPIGSQDADIYRVEVAAEDALMARDLYLPTIVDSAEGAALHALGVKRLSHSQQRLSAEVAEAAAWSSMVDRHPDSDPVDSDSKSPPDRSPRQGGGRGAR